MVAYPVKRPVSRAAAARLCGLYLYSGSGKAQGRLHSILWTTRLAMKNYSTGAMWCDPRRMFDARRTYFGFDAVLVCNFCRRLIAWPKSAKITQEEVDALHKDHNEFLMRFHSLVSSTNRPG